MEKQVISLALRYALPPLLGAVGAFLAANHPAMYAQICGV